MLLTQSCVDDSEAPNLILDQDKFTKSINKQTLEHLLVIEEPPARRIGELNANAMANEQDESNVQSGRTKAS